MIKNIGRLRNVIKVTGKGGYRLNSWYTIRILPSGKGKSQMRMADRICVTKKESHQVP